VNLLSTKNLNVKKYPTFQRKQCACFSIT
jgi:hypothetical protein